MRKQSLRRELQIELNFFFKYSQRKKRQKHHFKRRKHKNFENCSKSRKKKLQFFVKIEKRLLNSLIFDDKFSTLLLNIENFENIENLKFSFLTTSLININLLLKSKSKEYILKSKLSNEFKKLKFTKYINLYCKTYLSDGTQLNFCYDIDSELFFIFLTIVEIHFRDVKISKMTDEKRIRCQNIKKKQKSNLWINMSIKNKTKKKRLRDHERKISYYEKFIMFFNYWHWLYEIL